MKRVFQLMAVTVLPILFFSAGCEKKEEPKEIHFGTGPGDGAAEGPDEGIHFGTGPGDGAVDGPEEGIHFGTGPGDG